MPVDLVLALAGEAAHVVAVRDGAPAERTEVPVADLPAWVSVREGTGVRWVWADSAQVYAVLLRSGVRVRAAVDLRLVRVLLRRAAAASGTSYAHGDRYPWDEGAPVDRLPDLSTPDPGATLFALPTRGPDVEACLAEHLAQQACLAEAGDGGLRLLCHAESVGALIAQELNQVGVPFSTQVHRARLTALLGEPDPYGGRPARLAELCEQIRAELRAPGLNPDSQTDLVTALRSAGLDVRSTRKWELQRLDHPVAEPLLRYRELSRLHTANGWAWLQAWVREERFRPDWVAGGVVTGRWASRGGGALQLPRQIRGAVRADPGWRLVVADAAQLEPRVLAAMARDAAMAAAGSAGDLYQALVDQGVVDTRAHAKVAMLGAMYGATTGEAGALMPRLRTAYPDAVGLVDAAARAGSGAGADLAGPHLPAAAPGLAPDPAGRPGAGRGRGGRAACPAGGTRLGPLHPQLRRAGDRGRVGPVLDGPPAADPDRDLRGGATALARAGLLPARRGHGAHPRRARR